MNLIKSLLFLFAGTVLLAPALPLSAALPAFNEAKEIAKKQNKDLFVLCVGEGWLADTKRLIETFEATKKKSKSNTIWAIYNSKDGLSADERKTLGNLPIAIWAYPAMIYLDSEARPIDFRENASVRMLEAAPRFVALCAKKRVERDALWKRADSAQGKARAKLIGQGFDAFLDDMEDVKMREIAGKYKNKIEEIKKSDGDDFSGYHFKYTFWYQPFMEGVVKKNNLAKNYTATFSYVDAKLAIPVLTKTQRQQLIIGKYKTALEQGKRDEAMKFLEEAEKIDPKSQLGVGCRNQIDYYTKPVRLEKLAWSGLDSRPHWTQTSVVVPENKIKTAGTYLIEFKHHGGQTLFRNLRVRAGTKILGEAEGEKRKFDVRVASVPARAEVLLEFEMRGTGWFDGNGEILIEKR